MVHSPQKPGLTSKPFSPPVPASGKALNFILLGGLSVRDGQGVPIGISSKKNRALLVILALSPNMRASRHQLANLLWSDRDDIHARSSLRQSLAVLRKELCSANDLLLDSSDETI